MTAPRFRSKDWQVVAVVTRSLNPVLVDANRCASLMKSIGMQVSVYIRYTGRDGNGGFRDGGGSKIPKL